MDYGFTNIANAHQKVAQLAHEAEQCVGESSVYTGETEIKVEPDQPPTEPLVPGEKGQISGICLLELTPCPFKITKLIFFCFLKF